MTSFSIFLGCSSPTEKFDGDYQPDFDATLKINMNRTLKYIKENTQNFSINRGVIRCGKDSISEWKIYKPRIDGNRLIAQATRYIDREKSNSRAIMHEGLNGPENGNMFEEEISLELTMEQLKFCHWMPGFETAKVCAILFRGGH